LRQFFIGADQKHPSAQSRHRAGRLSNLLSRRNSCWKI